MTKSANALRALPALRDLDHLNDARFVIRVARRQSETARDAARAAAGDRARYARYADRGTARHVRVAVWDAVKGASWAPIMNATWAPACNAAEEAISAATRATDRGRAAWEAAGYAARHNVATVGWNPSLAVQAAARDADAASHAVKAAALDASSAANAAVIAAASRPAWNATWAAAKRHRWRWAAARNAARAAAWDAARERLETTAVQLQASALELLEDLVDPAGGSVPSAYRA